MNRDTQDTGLYRISCPDCDLDVEAEGLDEMEARTAAHMVSTGHLDLSIVEQ